MEGRNDMEFGFWKYKNNAYLDNQEVYENLSNGNHVEGLECLPVQQILLDFENVFAGWEELSPLDYESLNGSFQIFTTPQFVRVDCYSMSEIHINKVMDILLNHNCPLYDPQILERFDLFKED